MKKIFLLVCIGALFAREEDIAQYEHEGNLALLTSQQPSPLFCFGQNIVDKSDLQLFMLGDNLSGKKQTFAEIVPTFLYGISAQLSCMVVAPFAVKFKENNATSSGIEDLLVQFEYAFYNKDTQTYANQLTLVGNVTFPTGSTKKDPATGYGSSSLFLGITASHMGKNWYYFASPGFLMITPSKHDRPHSVLYQWGIGRNLYAQPSRMTLTLMLEFFGSYTRDSSALPTKVNRNVDDNALFMGPSLWFATRHFILDTGIAFPIMQEKNNPNKSSYYWALEMGWKFNG